jgi:peptidoglycan pentaglycine glycine transferase (the first glycine)
MALEFFTSPDLTSTLAQEIASFLDSQKSSHPFQYPQWADPSTRFVLLRRSQRVCWVASCGSQFPLGTRFPGFRALTMNRGPVCDDPEIWCDGLSQLVEQARTDRVVYLDAAPERPQLPESHPLLFGQGWKPTGKVRVSLRLDLTKTPDELLADFRKNTRYEVRRAERVADAAGCRDQAEAEDFLKLYLRLAERKGFPPDSPDHLRRIIRWLTEEPSRGALLLVRDQARLVGGAVIVRAGKRCWYVWGANDKPGQFSAGHWLQWQAILWAKAQNCTEYDFGGYTPGATSGPAWFKEGFGGRVVHFIPAHRYVIRRRPYRLFRILARAR